MVYLIPELSKSATAQEAHGGQPSHILSFFYSSSYSSTSSSFFFFLFFFLIIINRFDSYTIYPDPIFLFLLSSLFSFCLLCCSYPFLLHYATVNTKRKHLNMAKQNTINKAKALTPKLEKATQQEAKSLKTRQKSQRNIHSHH